MLHGIPASGQNPVPRHSTPPANMPADKRAALFPFVFSFADKNTPKLPVFATLPGVIFPISRGTHLSLYFYHTGYSSAAVNTKTLFPHSYRPRLSLYFHNIGCGSAAANAKTLFPYSYRPRLSLYFHNNRMRLGSGKCENLVFDLPLPSPFPIFAQRDPSCCGPYSD